MAPQVTGGYKFQEVQEEESRRSRTSLSSGIVDRESLLNGNRDVD